MNVSPVPAQTTFGCDCETARDPIADTFSWSKNRLPVHAAVLRFPDTSPGRPQIVDQRIAKFAGDCYSTVAHPPDKAPAQFREWVGVLLWRLGLYSENSRGTIESKKISGNVAQREDLRPVRAKTDGRVCAWLLLIMLAAS